MTSGAETLLRSLYETSEHELNKSLFTYINVIRVIIRKNY